MIVGSCRYAGSWRVLRLLRISGSGARAARAFAQLRQHTWLRAASECFVCPAGLFAEVPRSLRAPRGHRSPRLAFCELRRCRLGCDWTAERNRLASLPGGGARWQDCGLSCSSLANAESRRLQARACFAVPVAAPTGATGAGAAGAACAAGKCTLFRKQ